MENIESSIGVELEFLLCIAESDQQISTPERFKHSGAPFILPPGVSRYSVITERVQTRLRSTIENALSSLPKPGDRVIQSENEALADVESLHLRPYVNWTIGTDTTVHLDPGSEKEEHVSEYRWYSTEIASPALWATEASWNEIRAVVQAIKDEFWIFTPINSGMHYHYGHGKYYIPFQKLRRMAALLVAVDPLMVQLHPEHRRMNDYCLSNRLYSRVAHGRSAESISRDLGAEYIEATPEIPCRKPRPELVSRPVRKRTPELGVPFKRGELTGYKFSRAIFRDSGFDRDNTRAPRPLEIPRAVSEILRCMNAPTVAELMRYGPQEDHRPAYSFLMYGVQFYKHVIRSRGQANVDYQDKRTVEFRQMASTMEPEEVVAHGKVVVRLCEFASEADIHDLWKVVFDCTEAESHGDWYDIFDLLAELGLNSEAKVLHSAVARFRGEKTMKAQTLGELNVEE
ncbi:hypothetical protein F5Y03DRAFT_387435 [Xylaria venustula]|nr:hypothetical protein F5Y03DRAFT_387435 [Xylaria venustula]